MTQHNAAPDAHMSEHLAKLRQMAGQIADFFASYPEDQAVASVATHINKFWTARMRDDFLAAAQAGTLDLPPLVAKAAIQIRPGKSRTG